MDIEQTKSICLDIFDTMLLRLVLQGTVSRKSTVMKNCILSMNWAGTCFYKPAVGLVNQSAVVAPTCLDDSTGSRHKFLLVHVF